MADSILWCLPVIVLDALILRALVRNLGDDHGGEWLNHPAMAWALFTGGPVICGYCLWNAFGVSRAMESGGPGGALVVIGWLLSLVASVAPMGWMLVVCAGRAFGDMVTTGGSSGVCNRATCDQADRAARAHRYEEAERLYQEALFLAVRGARDPFQVRPGLAWALLRPLAWSARLALRRHVIRGPEAPIRLAFGNFLVARGRRAEAAEHWAEASRGDLPEEQAIMAAARAADAYWEERQDAGTARQVLADIVARFPRAPENKALETKLAAMPAAAPKPPRPATQRGKNIATFPEKAD